MQEITKGAGEMCEKGVGYCLQSFRFRQIMVFFLKWHTTGMEELDNKWDCLVTEAIILGWAVFHYLKRTAMEVSYYCATSSAAFTHLDKAVIDANQWLQWSVML